jgi:hypothetical protein
MNSSLYDRKAVVPDTLLKHLEQCFSSTDGDEGTEGYNRNKELREKKVATYQQIKRIKNWFDGYNGNKKDAPFILNGGDRMKSWCDEVLKTWRNSVEGGKKVKSDTGMQNQFNDTHEKNGINLIPSKRHEKGSNKFDTSIKEEVKKINYLIKKIL